jgi:serine/arginine repetitive matrix protein 2
MVDQDVGEIVIIKKKKPRVGLDGISWGTLGEATNVPKSMQVKPSQPPTKENPQMLKVKADEEGKWWSIGQGRKDSKEKTQRE